MPRLADPNVGPTADEARAELRRLLELWALGDEAAGVEAQQLERQLEADQARAAAAAVVATMTPEQLDAAIEARRRRDDEPAPPAEDPRP